MSADQTLAYITIHVLNKLDGLLYECQPDLVLIQGDTTTTFVSNLASFYH